MKINTSRFGELDVKEEDFLYMQEGLIGFPELTRYVLLDHDTESPFKWLQSIDEHSMAFVVISPLSFKPDYLVEVTEEEIANLGLTSSDDAIISVIVTIPSDPKKMSANLKAPLIFNIKNRKGKQLILKNAGYQTKHFILDEMKKNSSKDGHTELKKTIQQQIENANLIQDK